MEAKAWVKIKCQAQLCSRSLRAALKDCAIASLGTRNNGKEFILGFTTKEEAAKALKLTAVGEVEVEAESFHPVRKSGTIASRELSRWSVTDMMEELANCQVAGVERMTSGGRIEGSGRFRVDFTGNELPSEVKLDCGLILQVQLYVPAPLRCRKCLVYRHHEESCSKPKKCTNCARTGHLGRDCQSSPCCAACNGPHPVTDPSCLVFLREKEVNRVIADSGCSRQEAESKVPAPAVPTVVQPPQPANAPHPTPLQVSASTSYASAVYAAPVSQDTQSECALSQPAPAMDPLTANLTALTTILSQIVEQNKTIITQNAEVIRLLKLPTLKQSKLQLTPSRRPATPKVTPSSSAAQDDTAGKQAKRMRNEEQPITTQPMDVQITEGLSGEDDLA